MIRPAGRQLSGSSGPCNPPTGPDWSACRAWSPAFPWSRCTCASSQCAHGERRRRGSFPAEAPCGHAKLLHVLQAEDVLRLYPAVAIGSEELASSIRPVIEQAKAHHQPVELVYLTVEGNLSQDQAEKAKPIVGL